MNINHVLLQSRLLFYLNIPNFASTHCMIIGIDIWIMDLKHLEGFQ